jgi:hypothetical protein
MVSYSSIQIIRVEVPFHFETDFLPLRLIKPLIRYNYLDMISSDYVRLLAISQLGEY